MMLLQPTHTSLFLLPLVPLVGLVITTLLLRPSCHSPNALVPTPQTCEAYKLLAFMLDAMMALTLVFVFALLWGRGQLRGVFEPDFESVSADLETEQDEFVNATEREPLMLRARAYTFRVGQLPLLSDYGTMPGVESEIQALLGFYRFPDEGILGSLDSSSGSSSFASGRTTLGIPLSESPESMSSSSSMKTASPQPLDEKDDGGWTKWRWRQSTIGMSVSPTGATVIF